MKYIGFGMIYQIIIHIIINICYSEIRMFFGPYCVKAETYRTETPRGISARTESFRPFPTDWRDAAVLVLYCRGRLLENERRRPRERPEQSQSGSVQVIVHAAPGVIFTQGPPGYAALAARWRRARGKPPTPGETTLFHASRDGLSSGIVGTPMARSDRSQAPARGSGAGQHGRNG
jgi:hypothetical protein